MWLSTVNSVAQNKGTKCQWNLHILRIAVRVRITPVCKQIITCLNRRNRLIVAMLFLESYIDPCIRKCYGRIAPIMHGRDFVYNTRRRASFFKFHKGQLVYDSFHVLVWSKLIFFQHVILNNAIAQEEEEDDSGCCECCACCGTEVFGIMTTVMLQVGTRKKNTVVS